MTQYWQLEAKGKAGEYAGGACQAERGVLFSCLVSSLGYISAYLEV